jgi:hypothetical protein
MNPTRHSIRVDLVYLQMVGERAKMEPFGRDDASRVAASPHAYRVKASCLTLHLHCHPPALACYRH